ncbi:D-alanyl-D-alanine carboxypeptidase family protein [Naumannella halotolerans]|uniref:D-alanyl-D-alanine carboxypeptidase (Penicillin-binding protein 5/6) n=1 Tax=Naumannella halotolerans TaxID=993414 RepID=A0A4R7J8W9_9ACTN|nr:D-alanyl-D-alanine carboxypeptidase [Naumannella halotolerans]TDT33276.1 D-alanyl-D-alanine carboxypeptidase (penicillin-binding protein 5/6) [Naumannella halotolerans]
MSPTSSPRRSRSGPANSRRRLLIATVVLLVLAVLGGGGWYVGSAALAPLPAAAITTTAPQIEAPTDDAEVELPDYGAGAVAALGYDGATGLQDPDAALAPLVSFGSADAVPIGSIAKVVTALMIVDAEPLDGGDGEMITFTSEDVGYYEETIAAGGSNAPVSAGLELTEREALTLVLVPSANNYSKSLAIWAYGSYDEFLERSRTWLDEHGMPNTVMADSSGLSSETVSTPEDLLRLGQLLVADPDLSEIVALESATIDGVGTVDGTNALLGRDGIDGIKTGTTTQAGSCLLFSFDQEVDGQLVTMVGAIIGAPSHGVLNDDLLELIPSFNDEFSTVELTHSGQSVATARTVWGQDTELLSTEDLTVRAWGPVEVETEVVTPEIQTVEAGASLGEYVVSVNGQVDEVPLRSAATIDDPGMGWRLTNPEEIRGGS